MSEPCPKCSYIRKETDDPAIPFSICPQCGVVYSKYADYINKQKVADKCLADSPENSVTFGSIDRTLNKANFFLLKGLKYIFIALFAIWLVIFSVKQANKSDFDSFDAYALCEAAIKNYSRDPETAKVPYVDSKETAHGYYFSWSRRTRFIRMRNGFGTELPLEAQCNIDKMAHRITSLTINGKYVY